MATAINQFTPDYAVPPGWILHERLEAHGISQAKFARRCGRSPKLISEIIAGKAPLEPGTALQFEKVLGVDASVWLGIESDYQLHRAREAEAVYAKAFRVWLNAFPVDELVKRGCFQKPASDVDAISRLLAFFRVGSVEAWTANYALANVAYRHSSSFKSDEVALATWLRLGAIEAERQECAEYNESKFKHAMRDIRYLTLIPIDEALVRAQQLSNQAGVALATIKPLQKTALSGAAWWLSPRKAVIQLSARHKSDDHLWFSFFHEAAHVLLHSKKCVFVDGATDGGAEVETEANEWAANALIARADWEQFVASSPRSKSAVCAFADEQGIVPGIVVRMLQHANVVPSAHLNGLKVRYRWNDE